MRKLVLVLSFVLAVVVVNAQTYHFINGGSLGGSVVSFSGSANVDNGDGDFYDDPTDFLGWTLPDGTECAPGFFPPDNSNLVIDFPTLILDNTHIFGNITVSGSGELQVDATTVLNASNIDVQGVMVDNGFAATVTVSGTFNYYTPGNVVLTTSSVSPLPTLVLPPPVPVSLWSIVLGAGLIAGFTIVYKRRKQVLV